MNRHLLSPPEDKGCETMNLSASPILFLLIALSGMSLSLLGAMLPEISLSYHLTGTQTSSLPLAQFLGEFCGLILLGLLLSRPRFVLCAGALALATGALSIGLIDSFSSVMKAAFFLYGTGAGVLATLPGMIASRLAPERAARTMTMLYAFFSAGVMASPLIAGATLSLLPSYHSIFIGFGGLVYTGALITTIARLPCPDLGIGLALRSVKELLSNDPSLFIVVALMNLCYVAAETVPNAYVPKYLCETFVNTTIFHGGVVLSLFWGAMTLGRIACSALLNRGVSPRLILGTLAVFSSACLLPAALMDKRIAAEALFIASGLFLSGMFPIIISYSGRLASSSSSAMFILVMAAGMLGASMAGKAVGVLADKISFAAGMTLAVPLALLVLAFSPFLPRHT